MDYYSSISRGYDELHGGEQLEKARTINANCRLHGLLLDIGAGTGRSTRLFQGEAECIALDPALEMVRQFPGLKVVAKAEELPFKSACFDSIVSLTALHHAELAVAGKEIFRVAKPNACIAVSFFKRAGNFGQAKAVFKGFREIDSEKDLVFVKQ